MRVAFDQLMGELLQIKKSEELFRPVACDGRFQGIQARDKLQIFPPCQFVIKKGSVGNVANDFFYLNRVLLQFDRIYADGSGRRFEKTEQLPTGDPQVESVYGQGRVVFFNQPVMEIIKERVDPSMDSG